MRCLNLSLALSGIPETAVALMTRSENLPREALELQHFSLSQSSLADAIDKFCPDILFGQTHAAAREMVRPSPARGCLRVIDLHGDMAGEILESARTPWLRRVAGSIRQRVSERLHFPLMDGFTVVSQALLLEVQCYGRPVAIVRGGVDLSLFQPRAARAEEGLVNVIYAGSFRNYQGIDVLLATAKIMRSEPFAFTLIGQVESYGAGAAAFRRATDISNVKVIPEQPHGEMPAWLGKGDILVVPRLQCRSAEFGFPSKIPEYMAMGKAIVATDVGDHGRIISNGVDGVLVRAGCPESLATGLRGLREARRRSELGGRARSTAEQNYSWGKIATGVRKFFDSLHPTSYD